MKHTPVLHLFLTVIVSGCGPSAAELHEQTLSVLNTEADRWEGGPEFVTEANDAYGRPLTSSVEKSTLNYILEVRSHGPDGLPKNSDDIAVARSERHGETSIVKEVGKATEEISSRAASGIITGARKGLGFGSRGVEDEGSAESGTPKLED